MLLQLATASLLVLGALAAPPELPGYRLVWNDDFVGNQGVAADSSKWMYMTGLGNSNGEVQTYTKDPANAHLSGDGQLYIIPKKTGNSWTSARLETRGSWSCPSQKAMIFQSEIWIPDFTGSPAKFAGLWPAFWAKGVSNRNGVSWPQCGEWDILETVNKVSNWNYGTLHFLDANGNHDGHFSRGVQYQGGSYHTWAFKVDRRGGDWQTDVLIWYLDGQEYFRVTGSQVGTLQQWKELAWQPYFIILQMAVGGSWPGNPTANTISGYDASTRVRYTAVYEST